MSEQTFPEFQDDSNVNDNVTTPATDAPGSEADAKSTTDDAGDED